MNRPPSHLPPDTPPGADEAHTACAPEEPGICVENIPQELKDRKQWVLWRHVHRNGKSTKVPFQTNGQEAKSNTPSTWTTFEQAKARYEQGGYEGPGYMFSPDDPFCGVDLDGCRDPETGKTKTWAVEWIRKLGSYAEISPSMTGWKVWCIGENPRGKGGNKKLEGDPVGGKDPGVEIYDQGRYFAITGLCHDDYASLRVANGELREFVETFWEPRESPEGKGAPSGSGATDVIERARRYVEKMPGAVSGSGGHNQTFSVACCLVIGFDLMPKQAYAILEEYNQRCEPPWSEGELRHKLESANDEDGARGKLRDSTLNCVGADTNTKDQPPPRQARAQAISNCTLVAGDDGKLKPIPRSMTDIIRDVKQVTGDWPRRVGDSLFIERGGEVSFLKNESALFAYFHLVGSVNWTRGSCYVTKAEVFAALQCVATGYNGIETLPHEPRFPGHYYCGTEVEPGNGDHLRWLVDRFSPATDIDRDLIWAAFVTPGVGRAT